MVDIFKAFYSIHYNVAAVSVLLLLLLIFFLSKKNVKGGLIVLALLIAANVFVYKKTVNKSWTIEIEPEKSEDNGFSDYYKAPEKMTFSAPSNWVIVDNKGEEHHWCWVEDIWQVITNTDIVAWIWGENAGKKVKQSTENRINDANNLN